MAQQFRLVTYYNLPRFIILYYYGIYVCGILWIYHYHIYYILPRYDDIQSI